MNRFTSDPSSARNAIVLIVIADLAAVLLGALVIWTVDRREYEQFTTAVWYILQTVTTVGYGDVTPTEPIGRFIGGAVMLLAIASLSILTASITSAFIDARQAARREERDDLDQARWAELNGRLDDLVERLDRLEGANRSAGLIARTAAGRRRSTKKSPGPFGPGLCWAENLGSEADDGPLHHDAVLDDLDHVPARAGREVLADHIVVAEALLGVERDPAVDLDHPVDLGAERHLGGRLRAAEEVDADAVRAG